MTDDTTTITVTVLIDGREYVRQVQGTHWARDNDRTLYVYDDETTILEVDAAHVVEVFREADVETVAATPVTDTAPDESHPTTSTPDTDVDASTTTDSGS